MLAFKAFGYATLLVLGSAALLAELARRLLRIKDLDDLVERLQSAAPTNRSVSAYTPGAQDASLDADADADEGLPADARGSAGGAEERGSIAARVEALRARGPPPPQSAAEREAGFQAALDRLGAAGSVEEWVRLLKAQLDEERAHEVEERRLRARARDARIAAAARGEV